MCAGEDYDSTMSYSVVFHAGMTTVSFNISIHNDDIFEGNESFILDINANTLPDSVTADDPSQATIMIVDDDGK